MIIANITSFMSIGSVDAEHYYCSWDIIDQETPKKYFDGSNHNKLERILDIESEVKALNKKDGRNSWHIGDSTGRFNTIDSIHQALLAEFPNENIVTYEEGELYKDMLCRLNGKNYGITYFGEIFDNIPSSFYTDLLPNNYIIKCRECGREHKLNDISKTIEIDNGREWTKFNKTRDIERCCQDMELVWNVIF